MLFSFRNRVHSVSWVLLPSFIVAGAIFPEAGILAVVCMALPVIVGYFKGRIWCGHYCPRGSLLDLVFSGVRRKASHIPSKYRRAVRYSVFAALMALFALQLFFADSFAAAGSVFLRMVFVTTVAAFILGAAFGRRTWCSVCPMGTLAGAASRMSARKRTPAAEREEKAA